MEDKFKNRDMYLPSAEGPLRQALEKTISPYVKSLLNQERVTLVQSKAMIDSLIKRLRDLSGAFDREKYRSGTSINKMKIEELINFIEKFKDYEDKIIFWERIALIMEKYEALFPKEKSAE